VIRTALLRRRIPDADRRKRVEIVVAGVVSVGAYILLQLLADDRPLTYSDEMLEASRLMQRATAAARDFCDSTGIEIDEVTDPNRTCLIGPELTPLMTTLGHIDAKRTTTDPAMASVLVHLLNDAGVSAGDTIAVGSSASFPALLFATVAAAEAMGVHPKIILSLGASTYGATDPEFNLLDMYTVLLTAGVFTTPPAAISLGGDEDVGDGFDAELKADLLSQIAASGVRFISNPDLRFNVATRMEIYGRVAVFVNTGGSYANLGTSALALQLQPGLNRDVALPPIEERGVLFDMAALNVPVIHLLFIRGLAARYGVSWDPIPLREPGEMELRADRPPNTRVLWLIGIPYLIVIAVLIALHFRSNSRHTHSGAERTF
jgi:poly-gamma-glutamate system protein